MASKHKKQSLEILLKDLSCDFFGRESNTTSLLTVTRATLSDDMKHAIVYMSVFPSNKETEAIHFAKRMRQDLRDFLRKKMKVVFVPFIDIEIDKGEKLRDKIDAIIQK
jgi:ribosome-binding factor A